MESIHGGRKPSFKEENRPNVEIWKLIDDVSVASIMISFHWGLAIENNIRAFDVEIKLLIRP